jgi:cell division protease FtsH
METSLGKPAWKDYRMAPMSRYFSFLLLALIMFGAFLLFQSSGQTAAVQIPYSTFKTMVKNGGVSSVSLRGHQLTAKLKTPLPSTDASQPPGNQAETYIPDIGDPELLGLLAAGNIEVNSAPEKESGNWFLSMLPWLVFIGIYFWLWSKLYGNSAGRLGGRNVGDFLEGSAAREEKPENLRKITFKDVAGQENAKKDVAELVDMLKFPARYQALGAEIPHGVLLVGPPGTGKTLMARALAGEAGVPFFSISASEFIEMFVGVGASRVRHMFEEAKKRAPSIIFIDELDAIGRMRGAGLGGGHDEREQTLNQILSEMDGFSGHEMVIVLAATNRPDVLDTALLRPGRFDRHLTLELPDQKERLAILQVHVRKVPLESDVDLAIVAAETPGFSGADLKNLVNEASLAAAREKQDNVAMRHFDEMRDKILMGSVRSLAIKPEERHRLAVHECGHTVAAHYLPKADPLYKVTIIPRGRSLGGTHMLPEEERHTLPEDYLKDRLAVMLAGRAAEKEILGTVSSGADDDIKQATQLASAMVSRWGMSEDIGPRDLRQSDEHPFLGREIAQPRRFSETTAHEVDLAVKKLLNEAEARGLETIRNHRENMENLISQLEKKETLSREEINEYLHPS